MSIAQERERTQLVACRLGFWAAAATTLLTVVSFVVAVATPPRSGPNCTFDECVGYPYTDIAAFFPRDYLWMFPATLLLLAFLVLVVCVHYYYAGDGKKPFTLVAVSLAAIAAALVSTDYFIQLTVIQPSVLRGETDAVSLFSQYNPHGIFIALEALGYLTLAGALAFVAPAFAGGRVERALRWLFLAAPALAVAALVALTLRYGHHVEYRFEVAVITIDWAALAIGGALLCLIFRRSMRAGPPARQ